MKPTTFGTTVVAAAPGISPVAGLANLSLPQNFPVQLDMTQLTTLEQRLASFDFSSLTLAQIATLGHEAEMSLNKALDGFLARIDKQDAPQIFKLVEALNTAVNQEKLPEVAAQILDAKPTLGERILGLFSKKALQKAMDRAYEEARRVASGSSKKLSDVISEQEAKLRTEMGKVNEELRHMDNVKATYRESFLAFAVETAFISNALEKARATALPLLESQDVQVRAEAQDKLQALESRALALEGTLTKLPADQLVIRQLQNAGVATLQELATTMASRFASIKMTLLTIHGARMVQDVQRLGQQGADLDANLNQVRKALMQDVVGTAAHAPGKNREAQANQLQSVVTDTKELYELTENARVSNQEKFKQARAVMAQAREDMLALGRNMNPAAAYPL